ncbi:serine hydrolase domain-containing protein [Virgibacillus siamensis]|uniref:Serine hydrolase domain-containing protein n=1 Tax=Virgibacillus siamensis TaxID=480071 RepID=A0ABP3QLM7_9BACI
MENRFFEVINYINEATEKHLVPGVVLGIATPRGLEFTHSSGYAHFQKKLRMTQDTIFDLASITKVTSTLPAILQIMENGKLDLDDPIYYYLPPFKQNHKDMTIKHLLTHTSGFQPGIKFFLEGYSLEESITFISMITEKKPPGTEVIYSDLNFIILGHIVEQITGQSLAFFAKQNIYQTLDMTDTDFNPSKNKLDRIAATEYRNSLSDYQWGCVHDENAHHFGGVSGHAGLFSTVKDLASFSGMVLNKGKWNHKKILSQSSIDLSTDNWTKSLKLNRGLGWQLYDSPSFSGQFLCDGFGHTGYTGTSIWFSPDRLFAVILLTNRVHFGRDVDISKFRRIVHNLVTISMEGY